MLVPRGGLPKSGHTFEAASAPPADPAYRHALELGLAHDYRRSFIEFRRLAEERRGTDAAAWALYEAGLVAQADQDPAGAAWAFASLRRDFPRHRLTLRIAADLHAAPGPARAETADCGPRALLFVCERLRVPATLPQLRQAAGTTAGGTTLEGLARAAQGLGLKAEGLQADRTALAELHQPAVAWVNGQHCVAVLATSDDRATIHDPNQPREESIPLEELLTRSGGVLLRLSR